MSRQPSHSLADVAQAELEEVVVSGAGEGAEVMEEVEEQEGYSAYFQALVSLFFFTGIIMFYPCNNIHILPPFVALCVVSSELISIA